MSRDNPAFPAQWFDGLCRALPGDEFLLSPSPCEIHDHHAGWRDDAFAKGLTVATTVRTTRFGRTQAAPFVDRGS